MTPLDDLRRRLAECRARLAAAERDKATIVRIVDVETRRKEDLLREIHRVKSDAQIDAELKAAGVDMKPAVARLGKMVDAARMHYLPTEGDE